MQIPPSRSAPPIAGIIDGIAAVASIPPILAAFAIFTPTLPPRINQKPSPLPANTHVFAKNPILFHISRYIVSQIPFT
jgi:hypothetical protein